MRPHAVASGVRSYALLVCAATIGCSSSRLAAPGPPLAGSWGGRGVKLELTAVGGTVEYDCAHGRIDEPLRPDGDGDVRAAGIHVRERGGPIREGEPMDSLRATYVGSVRGSRLTFRVLVGADTLGPYVADRAATPQLFRCL